MEKICQIVKEFLRNFSEDFNLTFRNGVREEGVKEILGRLRGNIDGPSFSKFSMDL